MEQGKSNVFFKKTDFTSLISDEQQSAIKDTKNRLKGFTVRECKQILALVDDDLDNVEVKNDF